MLKQVLNEKNSVLGNHLKAFKTMSEEQRRLCLFLCEYVKDIHKYNPSNKKLAEDFVNELYNVDVELEEIEEANNEI